MLGRYHCNGGGGYFTGKNGEDCQVLSAYDQLLGGPGSCCEFPNRCSRTGGTQEMKIILSKIFGLSGYHHLRPLSYSEVRTEIDNDRPFIAALQNGFSGHVVVISGYELPNMIVVLDPLSGRHVIPYNQLRSNFQLGNWTETFTFSQASSTTTYTAPPDPYCCDTFGVRRCVIESSPGPQGSTCGCIGQQGYGYTCY